jgi:UDP-glucose 6-dehydrogenase
MKYDIRTYDPMATERTDTEMQAVIETADALLVLTPWEEFTDLTVDDLEGTVVFDIWRLYYSNQKNNDHYYAWGVDFPKQIR